jgi:mRNA-degrading endonuclease toxin of MazEF toxin-antitoxin module
MKRGEVWQVSLPAAPGHVQTGDRPAIIIQDDAFNALLPTVLVVPFTGNFAAQRFPGTLLVLPDGQNGLTKPSLALVFQARVLDLRDCLKRLGRVAPVVLADILAVLDRLTGR